MLGGQQDDVIGAADPVGGRQFDRHAKIAERARHRETVLGQEGGARAAHQKGHIAPRLGEPPAEIAADRAGPEHEKANFLHPPAFISVTPAPPFPPPLAGEGRVGAGVQSNRRSPPPLDSRFRGNDAGLGSARDQPARLHSPRTYRAAVRPLIRARPRRTSIASLSCSSLVVPISPDATVGSSPLGGVAVVVVGGGFGAAASPGALPLAAPPSGLTASGFFSAPRRSASRRRSTCATFSSLSGDTLRSGSRPLPWIGRPLGVSNRAVVRRIAPLPLSGISVSIALSPKVLLPSSTARRLSCSAPATSSASRAVPPLTSATIGCPLATSPGVAAIFFALSALRLLTTVMSPLSMKASAAATAASKLPPGLLRRSMMKPLSLLPACCRRSLAVSASVPAVASSKPARRI